MRIGSSRLRAALYGALCVITCYALWAIYARGYSVPALLLMPLAAELLWRMRRDPGAGALLCWRGGVWTLEQNSRGQIIAPRKRCIATPWVIYFSFIELSAGSTGCLWLYIDSVPQQQMRQLRVRLTMLH